MPITTDYLKLNKPLYTEAADIEVINGNMDAIDAAVLDIHGRQKRRLLYITESCEFVIPDNVHEIDIYLVNGGYNGGNGLDYAANTNNRDSNGYVAGGNGGAGGAQYYMPDIKVKPGDVYPIIVGASNGGITSFNGMSPSDAGKTAGGIYKSQSQVPQAEGDGAATGIAGLLDNFRCPLDGKYYGVSGAAGGGSKVCRYTVSPAGGLGGAGCTFDNHGTIVSLPKQGGYGFSNHNDISTSAVRACGGGGGSFDNPGTDGSYAGDSSGLIASAGNGGDAVTYGCGGGGGAGHYTGKTSGGLGGKGAQGVCIIAY